MVVLVDERPEEVTDMQRTVKGEVIASTFDRPADDHTTSPSSRIERAKRLVELGHDVVVLLDSLTRLARAYNLARRRPAASSPAASTPPRSTRPSGSSARRATSRTAARSRSSPRRSSRPAPRWTRSSSRSSRAPATWSCVLDRKLADKRIFPAIDVDASGTRKEEILMAPDELKIVWKLRRVLHALDQTAGHRAAPRQAARDQERTSSSCSRSRRRPRSRAALRRPPTRTERPGAPDPDAREGPSRTRGRVLDGVPATGATLARQDVGARPESLASGSRGHPAGR